MFAIEEDLGELIVRPARRRDPGGGAARVASEIAEPFHDRILAAGDPLHRLHRCLLCAASVNMPVVKERLLKKFEEEIAQLDKELKTELPREIKRARELGDLRENAEYQAAKERQRLVESRISLLQKRVSEIQLMNLDRIPHDKVGFGSTVTLREENGQTFVEYALLIGFIAVVALVAVQLLGTNVSSLFNSVATHL